MGSNITGSSFNTLVLDDLLDDFDPKPPLKAFDPAEFEGKPCWFGWDPAAPEGDRTVYHPIPMKRHHDHLVKAEHTPKRLGGSATVKHRPWPSAKMSLLLDIEAYDPSVEFKTLSIDWSLIESQSIALLLGRQQKVIDMLFYGDSHHAMTNQTGGATYQSDAALVLPPRDTDRDMAWWYNLTYGVPLALSRKQRHV